MHNYLQYRLDLYKHAKAERELEKKEPPRSREAHESGELEAFWREAEDLDQWKRLIQTRYYRHKADRLLLQMPPLDATEMWGRVEWDRDPKQPRYLTDEGLRAMRRAMREEEKYSREKVGYWFGIVVGIIGAISGLISVFKA